MNERPSNSAAPRPWSAASALLVGSVTVISGVLRSVEPHVIATRACWAAVIVYLAVRTCVGCGRMISNQD